MEKKESRYLAYFFVKMFDLLNLWILNTLN